MDAHSIGMLLLSSAGLAVVVWALHKIGKALIALFEALAAVAVVFLALWGLAKVTAWLVQQVVTHWRTSVTVVAVSVWWQQWGWLSLALTLSAVTVVLTVWRCVNLMSFDSWVGRWLRAWWQRWAIYAPKLPRW